MKEESTSFENVTQFLDGYVDRVKEAVRVRNSDVVPVDTYKPQLPSVLAGLLARQAILTIRLSQSPPLWDGHVAPLILRPMVEGLVTLKWILLDPYARSAEYISYGLGQVKLQLSKLQKEIEAAEPEAKAKIIQAAKAQEAWILSQNLIQFLDVNLGSWSGSSIRKMCEEIGEKDLYDWWFVPHSACAHNSWQHVSIWNTNVCKNPLHQEHRLSHLANPQITLDYVHQSAKFFSEFLDDFDNYYSLKIEDRTILEEFEAGLESL